MVIVSVHRRSVPDQISGVALGSGDRQIITELGIDPLALPWHKNGTPGTKSKVMKIVLMNKGLGISRTSFKHAWDRLNKFKYIRSLDQ